LMKIFYAMHDPTTLNRQGHDVGTQYRSIVLFDNPQQKKLAEEAKKQAQGSLSSPIVTEIVPLTRFYPAEDYHQGYYKQNTKKPYCTAVILPKVEKLRKSFAHLLKK
jgi:peptide-methionine (S)-S-oxide reductase